MLLLKREAVFSFLGTRSAALLVMQTIVFSILELLLQHAVTFALAGICFMVGKWFVSKTNWNEKFKVKDV
jgi:hypothetical protein